MVQGLVDHDEALRFPLGSVCPSYQTTMPGRAGWESWSFFVRREAAPMAGDWIKIDHAIHEKPEVLLIAQETGLDVFGVVGRLIRVWTWFDTHTENGCANVALDAQLDAWTLCAGFATAMRKVGWLTALGTLPNFERHNGKTAKRRAIAAETMRRTRCANVAPRAQPEKRREEKKKNPPTPFAKGVSATPGRRKTRAELKAEKQEAERERIRERNAQLDAEDKLFREQVAERERVAAERRANAAAGPGCGNGAAGVLPGPG